MDRLTRVPLRCILVFFVYAIPCFPAFSFTDDAACASKWSAFLGELSVSHKSLEPIYQNLINTCDDEFKNRIHATIAVQTVLSYKEARHAMFSEIDNNEGVVCTVYTNYCIKTNDIPNANIVNAEHAWPQSMGSQGIAKSDLHHLYPTQSDVNSIRGNDPYCNVKKVVWEKDGSRIGDDENGVRCFEPRHEDKGDIARSLFYFSLRYKLPIDPDQEDVLREWILLDPVSDDETERHRRIVEKQNNRNPLVDHSEFSRFVEDF